LPCTRIIIWSGLSPYWDVMALTTSIPSVISAKGANPMPSRRALLPRLMNSWVDRELGAPVLA